MEFSDGNLRRIAGAWDPCSCQLEGKAPLRRPKHSGHTTLMKEIMLPIARVTSRGLSLGELRGLAVVNSSAVGTPQIHQYVCPAAY